MLIHRKLAAIVILGAECVTQAQVEPGPPAAKRVDHREVRHNATVVDDYFWLRDQSNPEVIKFLEDENAYTEAVTAGLKPFEATLYKEMLGRIKQTDLSVPERRAGYFYYTRTEEGKQYQIYCRKKGSLDAKEEVLLDLNELGRGKKFVGLGAFVVSDDQNLLAYTIDYVGYRQFTLHVKDLRSGEELPDSTERVTSIQWASDNRTLLLTTEDAVTKRSDHLWRHTLGQAALAPVYEEQDALFRIRLSKTRDKKYVLLNIRSTDSSEVRYLRADQPQANFAVFLPREKKHRYDIDHRENLFYIHTNKGAKNFRVVTAPVGDPRPENWKVFIPHSDDVLVQGVDLFRSFAVAIEESQALSRMRIYDFKSGKWAGIPFPEPVYSAFPSGDPDYDSLTFRYSYQSLITPSSIFDYDTLTGKSTLLKQQEVLGGYDPSQYISERQWATARDGVRVPLSIVYKKGFRRDGKGPLFLYAYGSYGIGTPATFSSSRLSLLDRGMAYAIAHIRGGNEMGEKWHEDGMLMKKKIPSTTSSTAPSI